MRLGQTIYQREVDGATIVYAGEQDGWDMGRIVLGPQQFETRTLFSLLARGGWEPTGVLAGMLEPDEDDVVKHLAGTEFDHDQSTHAGGGERSTPNLDNTLEDDTLFAGVQGRTGLNAAGFKDQNANDLAKRLADAGANPNDLLALVMNRNVLQSVMYADTQQMLFDSAVTIGGIELPERTSENVAEYNEALRNNWLALEEVLSSGSLPDDVTVLEVRTGTAEGRAANEILITRDPDRYRDEFGARTLLENGEWQDGAVEALGYQAADRMMRSWARSAQGFEADAFANAAMDELGVDIGTTQSLAGLRADTPAYFRPEGPAHEARKALTRAMYENTQDQLREMFPETDSFVLYRGANHGGLVNRLEQALIPGTEVSVDVFAMPAFTAMYNVDYKPLSSWTSNVDVAQDFVLGETEFVASAVVPRERVFSTAFTGNGSFDESEFVVIGGRLPVAATVMDEVPTATTITSYLPQRIAAGAMEEDGFITINGQPIPLFKHLQGTEFDHDQSTHAGGRTIQAAGGRMSVTEVTDTTFRYEYGDYVITTNIAGRDLLEDALESGYYDVDTPPSSIEDLGEVAMDVQWNQWDGNFAMRHLSAAMMGLDHPYASGGESFEQEFAEAVVYGERPDDEDMASAVQDFLSAHAATTHAMVQAVADGNDGRGFSDPWEGVVRRGIVIPTDQYGEHPLLRMDEGDTLDMPLSAFSPSVDLTDKFLRGGEMSRDAMQSEDDFVFTPTWRSVMFEMDTTGAKTLLPAGWQELMSDTSMWVHTSYEDRAADNDDGENFRRQAAPWEVVTQGKFRVVGTRDVERQFFRPGWTDDPQTEDMRVITIQQTAVYNPRSGTYDALPGFVTLPDGRVIPVEEAE